MPTYVDLDINDWTAKLAPCFVAGPMAGGELTFQCPVKPLQGLVVRIYTSLRADTFGSASCGSDAIRVLVIDEVLEAAGAKPVIVNPHNKGKNHIKRTKSWFENTMAMARDAYKVACDRVEWTLRRRAEAGLIEPPAAPAAPSKPTLSSAAALSTAPEFIALPTKKARMEAIREAIKTQVPWTVLALEVVFSNQTAAEQHAETTVEDNGVGFTGVDGGFGSSLAKQVKERGSLSPKQLAAAQKMMPKYAAQVLKHLGAA